MRRPLAISSWRVLVIFLLGVVAGRFLIPLLEPREVHYVAIGAPPATNTCSLVMEHVTTVFGRKTRLLDEIDVLGCSEGRNFSDTSIQCRCPPPP